MENPLVSVIIPNYCHSKFLDERIMSVLNQTYQNFELIILDDCSPDDGASKAVIEKYRNNPKVTHIVYNEVNSGSTFKQWNKGFDLAKGELIWIAESDDSCEGTLLDNCVSQMIINSNIVLCFCRSKVINENNQDHNMSIYTSSKWNKSFIEYGIKFVKRNMLSSNSICNASAVVFRKSTIKKVSKYYMSFKASGDRAFWIEVAKQGNVSYINKPLNFFRKHNNEVSPKAASTGLTMIEDFEIYRNFKQKYKLSIFEDLLINANHYQEIICYKYFEQGVKERVMKVWGQSILFNSITYNFIRLVKIIKNTVR